jgi:outer membrane protein OmpA-like peptidoglycan-associated protein
MAAEDQPAASPDRAGENTTVAIYNALQELEDRRILFAPSSVNLVDGSAERLTAIAELFNRFPDVKIEIEGHTDTSGNADANMRLSQQRAVAVREALVERGVERDRLVAYGYGEGVPLVDNATPEGRARNRRIEFRFPTSGS